MARKEAFVTIPGPHSEDNRDGGKSFVIVEMNAYDLEWFAIRAFQALGTSGVHIDPEVVNAGAIGLFLSFYQAFMGSTAEQIKPLRDEMMSCVFLLPSSGVRMPWSPQLVENVGTLKTLREAWLKLHTGFTLAELVLHMNNEISARMRTTRRRGSSNTSTSREQ